MLKSEKVYSLVPNRRELGLAECPGWKNIEKLISGGGRLIGTKEYKCFAQDFRFLDYSYSVNLISLLRILTFLYLKVMQIHFFIRKNFYKENEPQKLENLKKMSRKRSASNA